MQRILATRIASIVDDLVFDRRGTDRRDHEMLSFLLSWILRNQPLIFPSPKYVLETSLWLKK
jgi:hypothetical protein